MSRDINDLMLEWLNDNGATSKGVSSAWSQYLDSKGIDSGGLNNRQLKWLASNGATSRNLPQAWREFLKLHTDGWGTTPDLLHEWLHNGGNTESLILDNNPQLALALEPYPGYSGKIAKVRRINAADEVDVYSFRDSDEYYLTGSGWQNGSGETLHLVEWYSQKGTNYALQTTQADQPLLSWSLVDGWYLDLQEDAYMTTNEQYSPYSLFTNFQDTTLKSSSFHAITGSSTSASAYSFLLRNTGYYLSLDGQNSNQGYAYRNSDTKMGPGTNIGGAEDTNVNQVVSIGMTTVNTTPFEQDLLFGYFFSGTINNFPHFKCRCILSYPTLLPEATTRADIHDLLMTQYGI